MLTRLYSPPLGYQSLQLGSIFTERNQYIGQHPTSTLRCAVLGASFAGLFWLGICCRLYEVLFEVTVVARIMHPPLTLHRHPMCADIIEEFQKCHLDHPVGKFFGKCTDLKIKLDSCFRQEKAVKRKANFEESKKLKERLRAYRKESADSS